MNRPDARAPPPPPGPPSGPGPRPVGLGEQRKARGFTLSSDPGLWASGESRSGESRVAISGKAAATDGEMFVSENRPGSPSHRHLLG